MPRALPRTGAGGEAWAAYDRHMVIAVLIGLVWGTTLTMIWWVQELWREQR